MSSSVPTSGSNLSAASGSAADSIVASSSAGTPVISIRGARTHNLQNLSLEIPRHQLVVITGVSGSGKSSLAFDTIHAEGRRRYLETLSPQLRQSLEQLPRPPVDEIRGLPPTMAIDQHLGPAARRGTLATITELHRILRVLYARAGTSHCPHCGRILCQRTTAEIVERILHLEAGRKAMILAPLIRHKKGAHADLFERIVRDGFLRARVDGELIDASDPPALAKTKPHTIEAIIDRIIIKEGLKPRLTESVDLALKVGNGVCLITEQTDDGWQDQLYSSRLACADCDLSLPAISPETFSFFSQEGACPTCHGQGVLTPAELPTSATVKRGHTKSKDRPETDTVADPFESQDEERPLCPDCQGGRLGLIARHVRLAGWTLPELCRLTVRNARDLIDHAAWLLTGRTPVQSGSAGTGSDSGPDSPPASEQPAFPQTEFAVTAPGPVTVSLEAAALAVLQRILPELSRRLNLLCRLGIGYLTLDRVTNTLSGGELQRARLGTVLGTGLTGVCFVLDEPTIALHPCDAERLLIALQQLRDQGNSVLLVEHDLQLIQAADLVIDLGPGAGREGGQLIAQAPPDQLRTIEAAPTGRALRELQSLAAQLTTQSPASSETDWLELRDVSRHNLRSLTVRLPLNRLVAVSGVSGSGKSTLIMEALVPLLRARLNSLPLVSGRTSSVDRTVQTASEPVAAAKRSTQKRAARRTASPSEPKSPADSSTRHRLSNPADLSSRPSSSRGELFGGESIQRLVVVDQKPLGRSGRSNPATATGVWDDIRRQFARTREARIRGLTARQFSLHTAGGRCELCHGRGTRALRLGWLPPLEVPCPGCRGKRFQSATLQATYKGLNIAEILELRIDDAAQLLSNWPVAGEKLQRLVELGLGYLPLGQSADSLSGGEAQRIKLARELLSPPGLRTLFVLDEPSTGLHANDVARLMKILRALLAEGHSVLVIEHQLEIIAAADWVLDLGPDAGEEGGQLVASGPPGTIMNVNGSRTGQALRDWQSGLERGPGMKSHG